MMEEHSASMEDERQSNFFDICRQCNPNLNCCRNANPPISSKRKKIIEAYLKKQKTLIESPFTKLAYVFPKANEEGYCIFHDKRTKKCVIHLVKPETCAAGPVTFDINVRGQKIEWHLKKKQICALAGMMYMDKEVLRKHLEAAKKEILRLVRELDSVALRAILRIEEPKTFKIDEDDLDETILIKLRD